MKQLPARIFRFWWGTGLADDVPALTYYLVLSLAPFALGLAALESLLLQDYVSALQVADELNRYLPADIHRDVERLMTGAHTSSPWLLLAAVATMLWTSSGAIGVVERAESRILDCRRHHIIVGRIRNMALGALVAALVVLAAASGTVVGAAKDLLGLKGALPSGVLLAFNAAGSSILFALVYKLAPLGHLRWRSVLVGAVPAGVALQLVPTLVGLYVRWAGGLAAVRLFLVIAIVLVGLYSMATVILIGAGLAAKRELRAAGRQLVPVRGTAPEPRRVAAIPRPAPKRAAAPSAAAATADPVPSAPTPSDPAPSATADPAPTAPRDSAPTDRAPSAPTDSAPTDRAPSAPARRR